MNHVCVSTDYHSDASMDSTGSQKDRDNIEQLNHVWQTRYLIVADTNVETFEEQQHKDLFLGPTDF